jgi:hypothetical protein
VPAFALLMLAILLFPDGRLTSSRWRPVLWAYAGLVTCVLVVVSAPAVDAVVVGHDIHVDTSGDVTNPPHLAGWLAHPPAWLVAVTLLWEDPSIGCPGPAGRPSNAPEPIHTLCRKPESSNIFPEIFVYHPRGGAGLSLTTHARVLQRPVRVC